MKIDDLYEMLNHKHELQSDTCTAGFLACAGYLSAILEQLRSRTPLAPEQVQAAFQEGGKKFARCLDSCLDARSKI